MLLQLFKRVRGGHAFKRSFKNPDTRLTPSTCPASNPLRASWSPPSSSPFNNDGTCGVSRVCVRRWRQIQRLLVDFEFCFCVLDPDSFRTVECWRLQAPWNGTGVSSETINVLISLQLSFADGTVYAGQFQDGFFHGLGVLTFPDKVGCACVSEILIAISVKVRGTVQQWQIPRCRCVHKIRRHQVRRRIQRWEGRISIFHVFIYLARSVAVAASRSRMEPPEDHSKRVIQKLFLSF